jgi:hypothetical protein
VSCHSPSLAASCASSLVWSTATTAGSSVPRLPGDLFGLSIRPAWSRPRQRLSSTQPRPPTSPCSFGRPGRRRFPWLREVRATRGAARRSPRAAWLWTCVRTNVPATSGAEPYVDAGGEQLWIDVLRATLKHGLVPMQMAMEDAGTPPHRRQTRTSQISPRSFGRAGISSRRVRRRLSPMVH